MQMKPLGSEEATAAFPALDILSLEQGRTLDSALLYEGEEGAS